MAISLTLQSPSQSIAHLYISFRIHFSEFVHLFVHLHMHVHTLLLIGTYMGKPSAEPHAVTAQGQQDARGMLFAAMRWERMHDYTMSF